MCGTYGHPMCLVCEYKCYRFVLSVLIKVCVKL